MTSSMSVPLVWLYRSTIFGLGPAVFAVLMVAAQPQPAVAQSTSTYWGSDATYASRSRRASRARNRRARASRRTRRRRSRIKTTLLPKRTPNGAPVQIVISLKKQKMTVYEGTKRVATSRISSGQRGHETPSGIFSIIHKKRRHYSNIYDGAPMPFMQRLTWSGIALHQGVVPGYPASHGCIRLPGRFARSLYGFTERRSHVIIARDDPTPAHITHPVLFRPSPPSVVTDTANLDFGLQKRVQLALNTATPDDAPTTDAGLHPHLVARLDDSSTKRSENPFHHFDDVNLEAHRRRARATRSETPLRILITRRTAKHRIRTLQQMLNTLGFDAGIPDGVIGRQTVAAIKAFQTVGERTVTGSPNAALYEDLQRATGRQQEPEAYIYVRQKTKDIYSAPVMLKDAQIPLGTHLYTLAQLNEATGQTLWNAVTAKAKGRLRGQHRAQRKSKTGRTDPAPKLTAKDALDRIEIPAHVRTRIEDLLTRGSSMIVTDGGHTRETGIDTDFIVLTR